MSQEGSTHVERIIQIASSAYGPYAFGLASVLLIWYTIVGPQLERQQIDFNKNAEAVSNLEQVAEAMDSISRSIERTATVLENVVQEINKK